MHRPQATANSSGRTNFRQYGVPTPVHVIEHYLDLIANYISDYCEQIQFLNMLDELISYSYENKRKFDIVAAFGMALLADEELLGKVVKTNTQIEKLSLGYYRNSHGQLTFGHTEIKNNKYNNEQSRRSGFRMYRNHL